MLALLRELAPRAALITVAGMSLGFGVQLARSGSPWAPSPTAVCAAGLEPTEISPEQAAALCGDPGVLVLDARSAQSFAAGHAAGAMHLPCRAGRIDGALDQRVSSAATIVVYGESSEDARTVAASLMARGSADVRVLSGGYAAWEAAGQACASGACDDCLGLHP